MLSEIRDMIENKSREQLQAELDFQKNVQGEDPGGTICSEIQYAIQVSDAGYQAACPYTGMSRDKNPYIKGSTYYEIWDKGWTDRYADEHGD